MVELVSRVSKGSKMDQVYIPKNRADFAIGSYVVIKPLETAQIAPKEEIKPLFYPAKHKIAELILNHKNIFCIYLLWIGRCFSVAMQ